jgi:hypothetical protein
MHLYDTLSDMPQKKRPTHGFPRFILLTLTLILSLGGLQPAWCQKDPLGSGTWERLGEEQDIKLGRKTIAGSKLFAVRGETEIPANIDQVASVICDHTRWIEWTKSMKGSKLLKQESDTRRTVYQSFDLPFPVDDRDVVYFYSAERKNQNGELVEIIGQTTTEATQLAPPSVGTRMHLVMGKWYLRPINPSRTHLVLEILMDPKGSMPSWFVNAVQRRYPIETLSRLRSQALKKDIKPLTIPWAAGHGPDALPVQSASPPAAEMTPQQPSTQPRNGATL